MQGQKDTNPSKLQFRFIVFLGVFYCIYPLSNAVVNVDARSYDWSFTMFLAGLIFLDFWRTTYSGFLKVCWAFTQYLHSATCV